MKGYKVNVEILYINGETEKLRVAEFMCADHAFEWACEKSEYSKHIYEVLNTNNKVEGYFIKGEYHKEVK